MNLKRIAQLGPLLFAINSQPAQVESPLIQPSAKLEHAMSNTADQVRWEVETEDKSTYVTESLSPEEALQAEEAAANAMDSAEQAVEILESHQLLTLEEKVAIYHAAKTGDINAAEGIVSQALDNDTHTPEGYSRAALIISALSLLWFGNMILGSIRGKEVSFIKHHAVFVGGLMPMATQIPGAIAHGLFESAVAFTAIMGISRLSRGLVNKVDFSALSSEEAKVVLAVLGPIASIITTPAASTALSPLRGKLTESEQYQTMHSISNVDGGMGIGDFPFLYVWMQKGILAGPVWQAELMAPIMLFHKCWYMFQMKVGPKTLWRNRQVIWDSFLGFFNFERGKLIDGHGIQTEEEKMLTEFLEFLRKKISTLEQSGSLSSEDASELSAALSEEKISQNDSSELSRLKELEAEIAKTLRNPEFLKDHVVEAVLILRRAMSDGHISAEELTEFEKLGSLSGLVEKVPGLKGWYDKLNNRANSIYAKISNALKFSHNEAEIGRVFSAQALAIGLLIPIVSTALQAAPSATEAVASVTSAIADNYAATAITWIQNNSKALSFSILGGALTIYGNMANLNFLGPDANFKKSLLYARYMLPTLVFAFGSTNDWSTLASIGAGALAGAAVKGADWTIDRIKPLPSSTKSTIG